MNKHLEAAIMEVGKVSALLSAIDDLFMEEAPDQLQFLTLATIDSAKRLADELDKLSEDKRMVDVIYAVNDVRGQN